MSVRLLCISKFGKWSSTFSTVKITHRLEGYTLSPEILPTRGTTYPLALISQWLKDCTQNHPQCQMNARDFVPTRLISACVNAPRLILWETFVSPPQYATLTHCWGHEKYDTLKTQNLHEFQRRIPDSALSRVFKDAITVAHDLSIPYIWIDSLCIIQDNSHDWLREAATMSSVYGESILNIAASGAPSGKYGCFLNTARSLPMPFRITRPCQHELYYRCCPFDDYQVNLGAMPLMQRGWALQERLLPSRTLHFTKTEVFWE